MYTYIYIHCNTLQHAATHCNTQQHTATYGNAPERRDAGTFYWCRATGKHCNTLQHTATHCNTLQHTATHCNTLQHTSTHGNTQQCARAQEFGHLLLVQSHCNILQHTATHCNTLQHTATHQSTGMRAHFTGTETANAVQRHTHRVRRSRAIVCTKRRSAFARTPLFASGNV